MSDRANLLTLAYPCTGTLSFPKREKTVCGDGTKTLTLQGLSTDSYTAQGDIMSMLLYLTVAHSG